MIPILVVDKYDWQDMKETDGIGLCHLMQIADFLGMENAMDELVHRLLPHIRTVMELKEFSPVFIPKSQIKTLVLAQDRSNNLFKLELFLNWLDGSDVKLKLEMNLT